MKNVLAIAAIAFLLASCGGSTSGNESTGLTEAEEMEVADSLVMTIEVEKAELQASTEDEIAEIDSLLENF